MQLLYMMELTGSQLIGICNVINLKSSITIYFCSVAKYKRCLLFKQSSVTTYKCSVTKYFCSVTTYKCSELVKQSSVTKYKCSQQLVVVILNISLFSMVSAYKQNAGG